MKSRSFSGFVNQSTNTKFKLDSVQTRPIFKMDSDLNSTPSQPSSSTPTEFKLTKEPIPGFSKPQRNHLLNASENFEVRERLIADLRVCIQDIVSAQLSQMLMSPQLDIRPPKSDQVLVDDLSVALSKIMSLCLREKQSLGPNLIIIKESPEKDGRLSGTLHETLNKVKSIDEHGIYWFRSLIKSKKLHSAIEGLLIELEYHSENWNPLEAQMLLNHSVDFVGLLASLKAISFFNLDLNAELPIVSTPVNTSGDTQQVLPKRVKQRIVEL